jgi:hypothetical protein
LGSRNGNPPGFEIGSWGSYCDEDAGFSYGSSADDRDFATHNVVMQNEIIQRPMGGAIRSTNWVNNAMNLIDHNRSVERATWPRPPAGCYVRGGAKEFILHGQTTERFANNDGSPTCERVTCNDGELRPALGSDIVAPQNGVAEPSSPDGAVAPSGVVASHDGVAAPSIPDGAVALSGPQEGVVAPQEGLTTLSPADTGSLCSTRRVPIDCEISGNNNGCQKRVSCPAGTRAVGAVAACNLENGAVSDAELAAVPPHLIHAARLSDTIRNGRCYVQNNAVEGSTAIGTVVAVTIPRGAVQSTIRGIAGRRQVTVGCKEQDENGGDCHIRGWLYCR